MHGRHHGDIDYDLKTMPVMEVSRTMSTNMQKYLAEFIGTFTLVFVGTAVATLQGFLGLEAGWLGISFAFGFTLMVLVMVLGPVSGCHINPAVTIPMAMAGRLGKDKVAGYLISQFAGAFVASLVLMLLLKGIPAYDPATHGLGANGNPRGMGMGALFGWELIMTALFLMTIFTVTRDDSPVGGLGMTALAIGGFLFVAHLIGAELGDSSLNPARSFGPAMILRGDALKALPVFIIAPIIGGVIGMILHNLLYSRKP